MRDELWAEWLCYPLSEKERAIARRVESILPELAERAGRADIEARFDPRNVALFREVGLLGLVVPEAHGGLGGGLRDMTAATFAIGTACPSTALTFFFHCSASSRGLLPMAALEQGLFNDEEAPAVRAFAEKLLGRMGQGKWFANFASESQRKATFTGLSTTAKRVDGGWLLNGTKSFGCGTGVADYYTVAANMEGIADRNGVAVFVVPRDAPGTRPRHEWNGLGVRGSATHGLVLQDVFVPDDEALVGDGVFLRCLQASRGHFVGNQVAQLAAYFGAACAVGHRLMEDLTTERFKDSGRPLAEGPFQSQLLSRIYCDMDVGRSLIRRTLELETSDPPLRPKAEVVRGWRVCKAEVTEAAHRIVTNAWKAGGTRVSHNDGMVARHLRDLQMSLIQGKSPEALRVDLSNLIVADAERTLGADGGLRNA